MTDYSLEKHTEALEEVNRWLVRYRGVTRMQAWDIQLRTWKDGAMDEHRDAWWYAASVGICERKLMDESVNTPL